MGFSFRVLGSSSAGNCGLLESDQCRILIDAGLSCRRIGGLLEECGLRLEDLNAVLLTHEHNDHAQGIRGLARLDQLRFFANADTAQALRGKSSRTPNWQIFETGSRFQFEDLEIRSFSVPHDAYDPVGFVVRSSASSDLFHPWQSMAWVTDLGYIPRLVDERVSEVELLVLEANHDLQLLERDTRRPWSIKQRIRGRHGHLSNDTVLDFLTSRSNACWREVRLNHLSRDCNNADCIREQFLAKLTGTFSLSVVDPSAEGVAPLIPIRE